MSNKKTDWKSKYYELRARYMNAIDVSFRLGFQEGTKASQIQNMQTQLQQAQQAAMAGMGGGAEELPPEAMAEVGAEELPPEAMAEVGAEELPPEAMAEGEDSEEEMSPETSSDELGASIQGLEDMVSKNEKIDFNNLMKKFYSSKNDQTNEDFLNKQKKIDDILKKW